MTQPGTPISHYEILSAIGKGGTSGVWKKERVPVT